MAPARSSDQRIAALQVGPVDQADGDPQGLRRARGAASPRPGRTAGRPSSSSSGGGRAQRRQPHAMRGRPVPGHRGDHRVEHRGAVRSRLERRPEASADGAHRPDPEAVGAAGRCAMPRREPAACRAGRGGTGDVRGPEPHQLAGARGEEGRAGRGRQLVGVRHPQDRARLGGGEGAQRDPVGQVRVEPAQPALVQPLRGQQQVDAERAAQPPDRARAGRPARAAGRAARRTRRPPRAAPASAAARGRPRGAPRRTRPTPVRLPAARSSSWRRVISPASASAMRSTRVQLVRQVRDDRGRRAAARRGRGTWRRP